MASYVGSFIGRYHLESITVSRCGAGISPASSERFAPGQILALLVVGVNQTDEHFCRSLYQWPTYWYREAWSLLPILTATGVAPVRVRPIGAVLGIAISGEPRTAVQAPWPA